MFFNSNFSFFFFSPVVYTVKWWVIHVVYSITRSWKVWNFCFFFSKEIFELAIYKRFDKNKARVLRKQWFIFRNYQLLTFQIVYKVEALKNQYSSGLTNWYYQEMSGLIESTKKSIIEEKSKTLICQKHRRKMNSTKENSLPKFIRFIKLLRF